MEDKQLIERVKQILSAQSDAELARILSRYSDVEISRSQVTRAKNRGLPNFTNSIISAILARIPNKKENDGKTTA